MSPPATKEKAPAGDRDSLQSSGADLKALPEGSTVVRELVAVLKWRREARTRRITQQRRQARAAAARTRPPNRSDNGATGRLYKRMVALEAAGKVRWDDREGNWVKRAGDHGRRHTNPQVSPYTADRLTRHFAKVRKIGQDKYKSLCPAHEDHNPSLSIARGHETWLIKCWAGCTFDEIIGAVGLEAKRLWFR